MNVVPTASPPVPVPVRGGVDSVGIVLVAVDFVAPAAAQSKSFDTSMGGFVVVEVATVTLTVAEAEAVVPVPMFAGW